MDRPSSPNAAASKKIYVTLIGSAPMAGLDALLLSLERFKGILSSDSAKTQFETSVRSILPNLKAVNAFIDSVYANKDPRYAVTMKGRTLIVEINQTKEDFLDCIHDSDINEILAQVAAVGTMQVTRTLNQPMRDYMVFPVQYINGQFKRVPGA